MNDDNDDAAHKANDVDSTAVLPAMDDDVATVAAAAYCKAGACSSSIVIVHVVGVYYR